MTVKLVMERSGNNLTPIDEDGCDEIYRVPPQKQVMVEITQSRSPRFHRFAFALFNAAFSNQDRFETMEALRTWLKIRLGYATPIMGPEGVIYWTVKSLSYASMDETEFRAFFERALDLIVQTWGFDKPALLEEIEGRTGLRWSDES